MFPSGHPCSFFFGFLSISHFLLCRLTASTQKVKSYMFLSLSTVNTVSKRTAMHLSIKEKMVSTQELHTWIGNDRRNEMHCDW